MNNTTPRYEFRAFAQNFGMVEEKIRRFAEFERFRKSSEFYILSAANNKFNTKIRHNLMDIKVFVKEEKGLQQWKPTVKAEFPIKVNAIRDEVFPALDAALPEFSRTAYTLKQYLEEIIKPHPQLAVAHVFKHRFGYSIKGCIAEIANLLINGAAIKTVAVESVDVEAVLKIKEMLGLQEYENVSYVLAIKRIVGMEPLPK
jgi:hypothetical protein